MKTWHWIVLGVLIALTLVAEFTVLAGYDSHWWNHIPAFYALFGFIGCVVFIFGAKWLGKVIIYKNEDYYDR